MSFLDKVFLMMTMAGFYSACFFAVIGGVASAIDSESVALLAAALMLCSFVVASIPCLYVAILAIYYKIREVLRD